jgi:hypothetical protein
VILDLVAGAGAIVFWKSASPSVPEAATSRMTIITAWQGGEHSKIELSISENLLYPAIPVVQDERATVDRRQPY